MADAEDGSRRRDADEYTSGKAGASLIGPEARGDAGEGGKREDGKREQQPAEHADRGQGTEYGKDHHDGGLP